MSDSTSKVGNISTPLSPSFSPTKEIEAQPYSTSRKADWDAVLDAGINGTFLHRREFMEYHRDRFTDASLILYKKEKPIAIFPAEQEGKTVFSHRGLTYAGWILVAGVSESQVRHILESTLTHYRERNQNFLEIRMVPDFFAKAPQDHLKGALIQLGAKETFTVTHHCTPLPYAVADRGKRWGRRQAIKNGLEISASSDLKAFWEKLLLPNLQERHRVIPTHRFTEISALIRHFPSQIRFFAVEKEGEMLGGALLFVTDTTAHLQYIAASPRGKALRCLDLLVSWLVEDAFPDKAYFNMGVSHIPATGGINQGLVQWKESFGGKGVEVATYRLSTKTHVIQH